jgi:hypothetical protein
MLLLLPIQIHITKKWEQLSSKVQVVMSVDIIEHRAMLLSVITCTHQGMEVVEAAVASVAVVAAAWVEAVQVQAGALVW